MYRRINAFVKVSRQRFHSLRHAARSEQNTRMLYGSDNLVRIICSRPQRDRRGRKGLLRQTAKIKERVLYCENIRARITRIDKKVSAKSEKACEHKGECFIQKITKQGTGDGNRRERFDHC